MKLCLPNDTLKTFSGGKEALEYLQQAKELPTLIFCDLFMPQLNGTAFLEVLKRDCRLHFLPVVMVSAEYDAETQTKLESKGAFHFIPKPFQAPAIKEVVERYLAQALDLKDLRELDVGFAEDALDQLNQSKSYIQCRDDREVKDLYRIYHTLKGGARSLQFPGLGDFIHRLESVLTALTNGSLYGHAVILKHVQESTDYLVRQMQRIKENVVLEEPSDRLVDGLRLIVSNVKAGWMVGGASSSQAMPALETVSAPATQEESDSQVAPSTLRISNTKLDELQGRFKKLQQIRVRLNSFAQELKSEFSDEGFPNQLVNLVGEMEKESMGIMEFFISLRVIPAQRLKTFATRTVHQAADLLKKKVDLTFSADDGLELDQSIVEVLETAITHLVRNSIDHGIEFPSARESVGKPAAGKLSVQIIKDGRERFIMRIEDDGAGLDANKLRTIVSKKQIMPDVNLDRLPDDKVYEFIFLDGLSTKQEVTELSGRGVGLSAVKERILSLGGTIDIASKPGSYTRFEIRLPRVFKL